MVWLTRWTPPSPLVWPAFVAVFRTSRDLYTARDSLELNFSPLSEKRFAGHRQRVMYLLTRMSAVPSAVDSAAALDDVHVCARLNRSVKTRM